MWKDSIRNIVVIFQPNILRIVGFYVRHSAIEFPLWWNKISYRLVVKKINIIKMNYLLYSVNVQL